jgi:CHAD domain-containing protein
MMTEPDRERRAPMPKKPPIPGTAGRPEPSTREKRRTPPLERLLKERAATLLHRRRQVKKQGNADAIHDLRVATRRLQEVIDLFEPVLPGKARKKVRRRARGIRRHFAAVRDADVLADLARDLRASAPKAQRAAVAALEQALRGKAERLRRDLAHGHGGTTLRVKGIHKRLEALLDRLARHPADPARVARAARRGLARRADELERARRAAASGRPLPAHRLRIAVKRWRYALEVLDASSLGPFTSAIEEARRVQEKLGSLHDLDVLLDLVGRSPRTRPLRPGLAARRRDLWNACRPLVAAYGVAAVRGLRGAPRRRPGAAS